jgi:hypothetical protein
MPDLLRITYSTLRHPVLALCHQRVTGDTHVTCPCSDPGIAHKALASKSTQRIVEDNDPGRPATIDVPVDLLHDADWDVWYLSESGSL